jgi:hypothetical protein
VFRVNGVKVGVIGAGLETTPELVAAGNTAGLKFLPVADRIAAESRRLHDRGVDVQIVVIHEGTANGTNAIDGTPAVPWDGPIIGIAHALGDTTVDAIVAGHIHRVSNLMVGNILVTEGINAGASCLVLQLMVEDGDVTWAGGHGRSRRRRHVGQIPGSGGRHHQLRRTARRYPLGAAVGRRTAGRDHLGRGVRGAAVREQNGDLDAHRRATHRRPPQWIQSGL